MAQDGTSDDLIVEDEVWYIAAMIDDIEQYRNLVNGSFQPVPDANCAYYDLPEEAVEELNRLLGSNPSFPRDAYVISSNSELYEEE